MATPHSYGLSSLALPTDPLYHSMMRSRQLNRGLGLPSSYLHPQFSLPYCFPYSNWFLQSPHLNYSPLLNKVPFGGLPPHPSGKPEQSRYSSVYRIEQSGKQRRKTEVIEISDDEGAVEVKTPAVVVAVAVCEKDQPVPVSLPLKLVKSVTDKQEGEIKISASERIEVKEKQVRKISKSHKINKKEKEIKKEIVRVKPQRGQKRVVKRVILSERINRKLKAMEEEHYHIPKREKEMLKITLLREYGNEIMTGPKFQAELPAFIFRNSDLQQERRKIREDLLGRLQKEEEEEEQ